MIIDGTLARFVDHVILEILHDFVTAAKDDNVTVELKNVNAAKVTVDGCAAAAGGKP